MPGRRWSSRTGHAHSSEYPIDTKRIREHRVGIAAILEAREIMAQCPFDEEGAR
jgi:hypothetical protein